MHVFQREREKSPEPQRNQGECDPPFGGGWGQGREAEVGRG